jgi:hypothetical protein
MKNKTLLTTARNKLLNVIDSAYERYHKKEIGAGLMEEVLRSACKEYYLNKFRIEAIDKLKNKIIGD